MRLRRAGRPSPDCQVPDHRCKTSQPPCRWHTAHGRPSRAEAGRPAALHGGPHALDSADNAVLRYTAAAMRRTAIVLTMLFAMLWQTVALARIGSPVNAIADLAHAALHWQDTGHHHHDDESYQVDDSSESTLHVVADHAGASLALETAPPRGVASAGAAAPCSTQQLAVPSPMLDGLLRPPRPHA